MPNLTFCAAGGGGCEGGEKEEERVKKKGNKLGLRPKGERDVSTRGRRRRRSSHFILFLFSPSPNLLLMLLFLHTQYTGEKGGKREIAVKGKEKAEIASPSPLSFPTF